MNSNEKNTPASSGEIQSVTVPGMVNNGTEMFPAPVTLWMVPGDGKREAQLVLMVDGALELILPLQQVKALLGENDV